jgi:hypothetical protein
LKFHGLLSYAVVLIGMLKLDKVSTPTTKYSNLLQPTSTMKSQKLIRVAIAAAGSTTGIASNLGLSRAAVSAWARRGRVPAKWIEPLCAMGGVIHPKDLLMAMAEERICEPLSALDR